jgi:uncharacterized repeat protein (TIGR01451 family)
MLKGFAVRPAFQSPTTVETFADDCVTPKTAFFQGETVCAKIDGVSPLFDGSGQPAHFINWIKDSQIVRGSQLDTPITSNPTFDRLTIPTDSTLVDTLGLWKVTLATPSDSSILPAEFTVSAPPTPPTIIGSPLITIYAADCMTPQTTFNLGDTVCARATNVDPAFNARIVWINANGSVPAGGDPDFLGPYITTGSATRSFTISPTGSTGAWFVSLMSPKGTSRGTAGFTVRDAENVQVDVSVNKLVSGGKATAGNDVIFYLDVTNNGPDAALNVQLTDAVPAGTTFVSLTQNAGPTFTCTNPAIGGLGTSTCTIAALNTYDRATFIAVYKADSSLTLGTVITNTANISSSNTTPDRFTDNNSSADSATVAAEACVVTCPADITNVPNTPDQFGAFVTFPAATSNPATGTGSPCGTALDYSHDSGSFFPVGTTVVSVNGTAGTPCSFTVEVKDTQAPAIDCPADFSVFESPSGSGSAVVNYAPPAAFDNDPSFTGENSTGPNSISCSPASGSSFNLGTTPVTCTATDEAGNSSSCTFNVTVQTLQTCAFTCPSNIVQDADTGSCGAVVTYAATTSDECGAVTYTNAKTGASLPSGSTFPVGTTTVRARAASGESCLFRVTIRDTQPPSFTCPSAITVNAAAGACNARLTINAPAVTDNCTGATIKGVRDDNRLLTDPYPAGTTTITWTAKDKAGLTTECQQVVRVIDNIAPVVVLVPEIVMPVPADSCQVEVPEVLDLQTNEEGKYGTASDNCAGPERLTIVQTPRAGTLVGPGNHTITVTVYDLDPNDPENQGLPFNSTTRTTTFRVVDNTPPTINAPADVTFMTGANATACEVTVTNAQLGAPTTQDNCAVTVTRTPAGNTFQKGTTTITWKVTDAGGNVATDTQDVTVIDNTPPTISCPSNIVVNLPLNSTANSMVVTYQTPVGTDNCAGATTTQTAGLASGAVFPVGTTTNTFKVTDAAGNYVECSFTVTVLYNFTGFFSPVNNLPTVNTVNAGRAIPVKFSLSGNKGTNIFASGYPASGVIPCNSSDPATELTETLTAGSSSLNYDPGADQYNYVWKTESSWAGTCRQLIIRLNDGTEHRANFKFK